MVNTLSILKQDAGSDKPGTSLRSNYQQRCLRLKLSISEPVFILLPCVRCWARNISILTQDCFLYKVCLDTMATHEWTTVLETRCPKAIRRYAYYITFNDKIVLSLSIFTHSKSGCCGVVPEASIIYVRFILNCLFSICASCLHLFCLYWHFNNLFV